MHNVIFKFLMEAPGVLEPAIPEVPPTTFSYEHALIKMLLTLGALLVFIFLAVWTLKRLSNAKWRTGGSSRKIHVLEKRPLSPKSMLYLIAVDGKKVLISESSLEVRTIAPIEEWESCSHEKNND